MPEEPTELTPEQQIAKLQTDLEQANKATTDAEAKAQSRANWGKALQHIRDEYKDVFEWAQDRTFNRTTTAPNLVTPEPTTEPEPTFDDPMEAKFHAFKQEMRAEQVAERDAYETKLANQQTRLNQMQSDNTLRETRANHPDLQEHSAALDAILEKHPSLGGSAEGMEIALSFIKKDSIREAGKTEAIEEIEKRQQESLEQFAPEPTGYTEPEGEDDIWKEGMTANEAIGKLFPE